MSDAPTNGSQASGIPAGDNTERIDELLADRAVFGLDDAEAAELERLLTETGRADDESLDHLAATVAVATLSKPSFVMPAALRGTLEAGAIDFFAPKVTPAGPIVTGPANMTGPETMAGATRPSTGERGGRWSGLAIAALAAALLMSLWMGQPNVTGSSDEADITVAELTLAERRAALVAEADDVVQLAWGAQDDRAITLDAEAVVGDAPYGDVVWSDARNEGFLRFRGLAANDPTVEQYQLWVFDEERPAETPVDGGVFDVIASDAVAGDGVVGDEAVVQDIIVPIDVKLPVTKATLFAITVERPGGVVVSKRERLPLLAAR